MYDPFTALSNEGIDFLLSSFSALDRFFRVKDQGTVYINTDATLPALAKLFDTIDYPGFPFEDASLEFGNNRYAFRCVDNVKIPAGSPFTIQKLLYNEREDKFIDPLGVYGDLRRQELVPIPNGFHPTLVLMEAAKLVSRYHYSSVIDTALKKNDGFLPTIDMQRDLLVAVLCSKNPEKGFKLLLQEGFIERFWPELFTMIMVTHSKEYHPEGDVWEHTLETFKHRKKPDLLLSLGLLLHDIGKPVAQGTSEKPFHDHAELGVKIALRFLNRLGFSSELIDGVTFLIKFHMLPAALKKLPLYRTEKLMESPLFPTLLELYRADLESSFRLPKGYYEACGVYKAFLKNKNNPYKSEKEYRSNKRHLKR
jgi:poly(A) polymerase